MNTSDLLVILYAGIILVLPVCIFIFIWRQRKNSLTRTIIKEEQERKAHPNIQSGKFTRLYTMPYDEELTGKMIEAYFKEHCPDFRCSGSDDLVKVSEDTFDSTYQKRELRIIHLRSENITAIDVFDPYEVTYSRRGAIRIRSSLQDLGFGDKVRETIRAIQAQSIARTTKRK